MVNKPKRIGTESENGVLGFLLANGFPYAERTALKGGHDTGDITGTPGVCWQVKGGEQAHKASDLDIETWMAELHKQTANSAHAELGVLVVKRSGYGKQRAGDWWAYLSQGTLLRLGLNGTYDTKLHLLPDWLEAVPLRMHLRDAVGLLRWTGYGDPL